jgi:hypothetical protein
VLMTVNTELLAPTPSPTARATATVKRASFMRRRPAKRMSCEMSCSHVHPQTSRASSRMTAALPRRRRQQPARHPASW